jgi:hypothetical protein
MGGPADQTSVRAPGANELFEIKPIILGGDPVDPANKIWVTRAQHIELVRYWNKIVRYARAGS